MPVIVHARHEAPEGPMALFDDLAIESPLLAAVSAVEHRCNHQVNAATLRFLPAVGEVGRNQFDIDTQCVCNQLCHIDLHANDIAILEAKTPDTCIGLNADNNNISLRELIPGRIGLTPCGNSCSSHQSLGRQQAAQKLLDQYSPHWVASKIDVGAGITVI